MLLPLLLLVVSRVPPPLPMVTPPGCEVRVTATHLLVKSQGVESSLALGEDELPSSPGHAGPPRLTVLPEPGAADRLLVGVRDHWDGVAPAGVGRLYEVTCGPSPRVRVALVAPGLDFGRVALLADGRWVVGGWGGLRVLDPVTRRLTPLTAPPPFEAPRCWSAADDRPAPAADVPVVDDSGVARPGSEVHFDRVGACGYEAEMIGARLALDVNRGVVRSVREVATFARGDDGRMLAGDGAGSCDGQTPGAAWSSSDGVTWTPLAIRQGPGGIARLTRLPPRDGRPGTWLALTAICGGGGAVTGGDVYASADLDRWDLVLGEPPAPAAPALDRGAGVVDLLEHDGRAYALIADGADKKEHWFRSIDGRTWDKARRPPMSDTREARGKLAAVLGVSEVHGLSEAGEPAFAWTSDGLFQGVGGSWTRIFPR